MRKIYSKITFCKKKREFESLKKKDYLLSAEHCRGKTIKYPSPSVVVFIFLTFLKKNHKGISFSFVAFF